MPGLSDIEVTYADLETDSQHYADLSQQAHTLQQSVSQLTSVMSDWGLLFAAKPAFDEAVANVSSTLGDAGTERQRMSNGLTDTVSDYQQTEAENVRLAQQIMGG